MKHLKQIKLLASILGLFGSAYLFTQTKGWNKVAAVLTATGTTSNLWMRKQQSPTSLSQQDTTVSLLNPENEYRFTWNIIESENEQIFTGKARSVDFGDRVVFIQTDEGTNGTYVMDLKRMGQSVSGIWWYIGGTLPQGTYRGKIHPAGIVGTWQSPDGKQTGDWNFDLITLENSFPEENG